MMLHSTVREDAIDYYHRMIFIYFISIQKTTKLLTVVYTLSTPPIGFRHHFWLCSMHHWLRWPMIWWLHLVVVNMLLLWGTLADLCHWDVVPLGKDRSRHRFDVIVIRSSCNSIFVYLLSLLLLLSFNSTLLDCISDTIIFIVALEAVLRHHLGQRLLLWHINRFVILLWSIVFLLNFLSCLQCNLV